jgi:hypothetical protein
MTDLGFANNVVECICSWRFSRAGSRRVRQVIGSRSKEKRPRGLAGPNGGMVVAPDIRDSSTRTVIFVIEKPMKR